MFGVLGMHLGTHPNFSLSIAIAVETSMLLKISMLLEKRRIQQMVRLIVTHRWLLYFCPHLTGPSKDNNTKIDGGKLLLLSQTPLHKACMGQFLHEHMYTAKTEVLKQCSDIHASGRTRVRRGDGWG